jgi:hypothetical protein
MMFSMGASRFDCVHLERTSDVLIQNPFLGDTPLKVLSKQLSTISEYLNLNHLTYFRSKPRVWIFQIFMECFDVLNELIPDAFELAQLPVEDRELRCHYVEPMLSPLYFYLFVLDIIS